MFRYRIAENGMSTMVPYNPRVRSYWKDKNSGRVLVSSELKLISELVKNETDPVTGYEKIINVITGEELGRLKATVRAGHGGISLRAVGPESYEDFMLVKSAYDILLRKKGFDNPDVAKVLTESNEYIISHNTRPSPDAVQCEECHERKQSGAFSSLVSPLGIMGKANEKKLRTIPDARLVAEGSYILDLAYMKIQANGDITENVEDILFETKLDPFMTILKNSSATEVIGEFRKIDKASLLSAAGPSLAALMSPDLPSANAFFFQINKGDFTLRDMAAAIDGNTVNNILFPTYRGALGIVVGAEAAAQGILDARSYGQLRSDVFFFDVRDSAKKHISSFNGASMFIKAAYTGSKTGVASLNIVMASWDLVTVKTVAPEDILMMAPATDGEEGFVVFKTTEPGYFIAPFFLPFFAHKKLLMHCKNHSLLPPGS